MMDSNPQRPGQSKAPQIPPSTTRKRSRASSDDEERAMEEKRIKARERQRRKRERDRSGRDKSGGPGVGFPSNEEGGSHSMGVYDPGAGPPLANGHRNRSTDLTGLSPEEAAKKEKVRVAARERQRKHRASVKAKRMAELGMAIVNAGGGVEQTAVGYVLNEHGQYEPVMEDPNNPHHHPHPPHEPPFPVPQPHTTPGQTFASTLMLSFTCAPLLKQHLLRTLHITDEELASFEPVIAAAWDHWDHERAMHYAAVSTASDVSNGPSTSYLPPHPPPHGHQPQPPLYPSSDFRARFHRPLLVPFPASAPPPLRHEGAMVTSANGSATNGSYGERREEAESEAQEEHDGEESPSSPSSRPPAVPGSIDPTLEAGGTSDVRGQRDATMDQGDKPQAEVPQEARREEEPHQN